MSSGYLDLCCTDFDLFHFFSHANEFLLESWCEKFWSVYTGYLKGICFQPRILFDDVQNNTSLLVEGSDIRLTFYLYVQHKVAHVEEWSKGCLGLPLCLISLTKVLEAFSLFSLMFLGFFTCSCQTPPLLSGYTVILMSHPFLTHRLVLLSRRAHSLFCHWLLLARSDLQLSALILQKKFSLLNPRIT